MVSASLPALGNASVHISIASSGFHDHAEPLLSIGRYGLVATLTLDEC
jgi:hypothetical protein